MRFKRRRKEVKPKIQVDPSLSKTTCRVCLENKRTPTTPMEADNLAALFKECTGFDVLLHLGSIYIPTHICNKCKAALKTTKAFLMQSQKTENILQQIYRCEDLSITMQLFRKFKAESEEIEASNKKLTKKFKEPEMNTVITDAAEPTMNQLNSEKVLNDDTSDDDLIEMHQGSYTDDDCSSDDLEVLLKPARIVKVKRQQLTGDEQQKAETAKNPIKTSDDGWTEKEIAMEPFINIKKGKKRGLEMTICQFCGKALKNLKGHLKICKMNPGRQPDLTNPTPTEPFECALCGRKFKKRLSIGEHLRIFHGNIFPYKCQFCCEKFKYPANRQSHIRSKHMVRRPFECPVCSKGYVQRYALNVHLRSVHTKETPFACKLCHIKKYSKAALNNHIKYVHSEHPVHCDVCNKAFNCKKYLQQHYVIHTKEKNYQCPCCEKAFAINHVLRSHVKKMHTEYQMPPAGTIVSVKAVETLKKKQEEETIANYVKTDLKF